MSENFTRFFPGSALTLYLIALSAIISIAPLQGQGTTGVQVSVGSDSVAKGAEVCVPVRISNFNRIVGMEFTLTYDTTLLRFKSVRNFNLVGLTESNSFGLPGSGINKPGGVKVSWLDPSVSGVTVPDGTVIFQVCFTTSNVDATTSVNFGGTLEAIGDDGGPVPLNGSPGTIKIGTGGGTGGGGTGGGGTGGGGTGGGGTGGGGTGGGGTGGGTFTMNIGDRAVSGTNQAFCLGVKVAGFASVLGIELTMNYNPAHLAFDSLSRFNLSGLNASTFGLPGAGTNPLGSIKLAWVDPNATGVTVADSTEIFALCFRTLTDNISTTVTFGTGAEITDKDERSLTFNGIPGYVTVGTGGSGGGTGGGGTGSGGFSMNIGDRAVSGTNQAFCLGVKVAGFVSVLGIELTVNYNPAHLAFDSLSRFNLSGLNASTFGLPGAGTNPLGSIKLAWVDPNVTGVTLADSTEIFALCFRALTDNISTTVTFGTGAEITDKDERSLTFNGIPGYVTVGTGGSGGGTGGGGTGGGGTGGGGTGTGGFSMNIGDRAVSGTNQAFCLGVKVAGFVSVLGIELTVNYNPAHLVFDSLSRFNLSGLNASAFGLPGAGTNPLGSIKLAWVDPNVTGVTLADSTEIFALCFRALTDNVSTTVTFGTSAEITDKDERSLTFNGIPGYVTVGTGGSGGGTGGGGTGGGGTGGGGTGGGGTGGTIGTGTFTLNISDAAVSLNQSFCLDVKVASFRDILGMEFAVNYNPAQLVFDSLVRLNLTGLNESSFGLPGSGSNLPGSIKMSWVDPNVTGVSIVDSTSIFSLCFRALQNNVTAEVIFASGAEIVNKSESVIAFSGLPGVVTIGTGGGGSGGGSGNFALTVGSATVASGQQVCLPVTVTNFTGLLGMEFTITYDAARLQFQSVDNLTLAGLTREASFGLPGTGANPLGAMKVSWNDPDATGKSLSNGSVLFRMCFTAVGANNTSATVGFSSTAEVVAVGDRIIPLTRNAGTVTISGGGGTTVNNLSFVIGNKASPPNQRVCLDVKVARFTNILGMQFTMNYNTAALRFDTILGLNLNGLTLSNFGLPGQGVNLPGAIKLSWVDPNVRGVTLSDSTSIFQACFTPIGSNGTVTPVSISTQQLEVTNTAEQSVPVNIVNGAVTISNSSGGGGSANLALVVGNKTSPQNQRVCLDVKVARFTNILGMEFTMNYNATALAFDTILGFNLNGLTIANFGLPGQGLNQPGSIKLSWVDPNVTGITISDSTSIFQVCFRPTASNGTVTPVSISTQQLEVTNTAEQSVPVTVINGSVTIGSGSTVNPVALVVGNKTSPLNQRVCLDVKVGRFSNIRSMQFTMTYNPAILMYDTLSGFNLSGLSLASFTLPGQGTNPTGSIRLSWTAPGTTGITLADSTSIFMACFKPISGAGSSTPVAISTQQLAITNAAQQSVPAAPVNGSVAVESPLLPGGLVLEVESKSVLPGQDFCLNVSVTNFTSIVGMEFNLAYNTDSLTFRSVGAFNLAGLAESSFGIPGVGVNPLGNLKISWLDPNVTGISLVGKVNIFQVCFSPKVSAGATRVRFDTQKIIEITNAQDQQVSRALVNGLVTLQSGLPPLVIATPAQITPVRCFGASTGAINITAQGGSGNYSYRWNYQNATTRNLANIPAGNYSVTVTDTVTRLTVVQSFTVTQPAAGIQITSAVATPVTCFGLKTGRITLSVQGGAGQLGYAWSGGLPAVSSPTGLGAGAYTVTITDSLGCQTTSAAIVVTQPDTVLQVKASVQAASCLGVADGSIGLVTTGGTAPYTYLWSNNLAANLTVQSGLTGGTYGVTATDARGCTASTTANIVQGMGVDIVSIQPGFIDAGNDGNINVGVSGGTMPYRFSWSGPGNFAAVSEDVSRLSAVGDYCITVTDAKGCKDTACAVILQRLKVVAGTIREACSGGNDGSISISPSGGQQPYTFRWSNGSTSQNLTGLDAGTYIVTITDALSNTISGSFEVVRLTAIAVSGTVTAARGPVGIANGSINASVSGGKPDYTLLWSTGATSPSISNLTAGQYCLSVTDKNGCTATRCFQVAFEALPLTFSATKVDNRCFGESRGVVRITINGGIGPYVATFNDGTKVNANRDGLIERGNLAEGLYSFVISDSVNVTVQGSVSISQPTALRLNQTTVRHDNENPGCTGGITIALSGGTAPYLVRWNSNNAGTLITNLCEGLYVPTVEDANGCMVTMDPIQVNTFGYVGNIIDNLCPGDVAGDVGLNVFGGSEPYSYTWMNSRGDTILRSKDLMNVASGTYRVVVGEASGNTLMKQFVIETESDLRANAQVVSNYLGFGVSCPNAADGILSASGLNGIGTNFMYEWLSGQQLVGSQQRLQNARAGTYVVRITDQGGCIAETSVTLTAPPQLGINGSVNNISCQGARDGDILISASGGVPGSIYAYRWSTGATGPRISFLPAGNYSATVSDANNCAVSAMFNISEPQPLSVKVETAPATVGVPNCDGAARVTVTGGTRPYTYIANVPNNRPTDSVFLKLCPGDYVLQVRDSRGCKTSPEQIGFGILDRTLPCLETRSVISPDGDGANDIFEIFCIDELSENRLIIFNQWGQLVFETLNYSNNWSGRSSSGEELPEGAYYYILEYTDKDGKRVQVRGSLTLLRN